MGLNRHVDAATFQKVESQEFSIVRSIYPRKKKISSSMTSHINRRICIKPKSLNSILQVVQEVTDDSEIDKHMFLISINE